MDDQASVPSVEFDEDGLFKDPTQWNQELATLIAGQNDIPEMTDLHWKIIYAIRDYYREFQVAPPMAQICWDQGMDKHCIHDLFHTCLNAWKIAGLPNPGEEAKSYLSDM